VPGSSIRFVSFRFVLSILSLLFLLAGGESFAFTPVDFNGGQADITAQPAGTWEQFQVVVPAGALGWDLRIEGVGGGTPTGRPMMVVRRDSEATSFITTQGAPPGYGETQVYTYNSNTWPSDWSWAPGFDWTGREFSSAGVSRSGQVLVMGMGSPLEPGTYYVGVSNNTSDTSPMTYRLISRGIGLENENDPSGNPWAITVRDLLFEGGRADITGLQPREVSYYRVNVPSGSASWSVKLEPSAGGEGLLAIRKGSIPNIRADGTVFSDANYYFQGTRRAKGGEEYFYKYPASGFNTIPFGIYFIAVVSEGSSPPDANTVGSAPVDCTLRSLGVAPVTDRTSTPLQAGTPVDFGNDTLAYGEQKRYRFRVPSGLTSMEVRLRNRVNNPKIFLCGGSQGSTCIPMTERLYPYRADDGGANPLGSDADAITVPAPSGDYTIVVAADRNGSNYVGATYNLSVSGSMYSSLNFNGGEAVVSGQEYKSWRFFRVQVPSGALGWDLGIKDITSGAPRLVVCRDIPVAAFLTTSESGYIYQKNIWPSGWCWAGGTDLTGRSYSASGEQERGRILRMGMGSPLEPGTYFVGVSNDSTNSASMSYRLQSRGIGVGQDGNGTDWAIQVMDLALAGGANTTSGLMPRDVVYYRVTVPPGILSWSLRLNQTIGEAVMAVRRENLPNSAASKNNQSDELVRYSGTKRQKSGTEYFYKYANYGGNEITPGTYYVMVVSEGVSPIYSYIGVGPVSYTINSIGEMPISDLSSTPLDADAPLRWAGQSLDYGEQKVYRFQVPVGFLSMEVRLSGTPPDPILGNPRLTINSSEAGLGRIPRQCNTTGYEASEGGDSYINNCISSDQVFSEAEPAGEYTVMVVADTEGSAEVGAAYDLVVEVQGEQLIDFNGGQVDVISQSAASWKYFRVEVPSEPLGWDLRLDNVTSGRPRMVVARDVRPTSFSGGTQYLRSSWNSGGVWVVGSDWTERTYSSTGQYQYGQVLAMGMNAPLSPGTYYVGIKGDVSDSSPLTYRIRSRGIGSGMDSLGRPWVIPVTDLGFEGGVVTGPPALAPREAAYYRVTVPPGASTWSFGMEPTLGEAMVAVREGTLPNIAASPLPESDSRFQYQGTKRQKMGREFFYKYPASGTSAIKDGNYYIAVVSEGISPSDAQHTGTGTVDYTLTSMGAVPILDNTGSPLQLGSPVSWPGEILADGAQKVYRFRVPSGFTSMEIRLRNRTGNPKMSVYGGPVNAGRIPEGPPGSAYQADEGGEPYIGTHYSVMTIPEPSGDYTVVVASDVNGNGTNNTSYDLVVTGQQAASVDFNLGQADVTEDQEPGSWKFVRVDVPSGPLGWELRIHPTSGTPRMVVSRDHPVPSFTTSYWGSAGGPRYVYQANTWPSGWSWAPDMDWSGREFSASGASEKGQVLSMGIGTPLQPGVYYIGISNEPGDISPIRYVLESRGIGEGSPWDIQVGQVSFSGGPEVPLELGPREAAYYKVTVPQGASSWALGLESIEGEALVTVRKGFVGNMSADATVPSDDAVDFEGTKRQKTGQEYFYKYPNPGSSTIAAGDYYITVVGEGLDPSDDVHVGSGTGSYVLQSLGEVTVSESPTASELQLDAPLRWIGEALSYGEQRVYRLTVPPGFSSMEFRLLNQSGYPKVFVYGGLQGVGKIPRTVGLSPYQANEGGENILAWGNPFATLSHPEGGEYTIVVAADSNAGSEVDAAYDLEVTAQFGLPLTSGFNLVSVPAKLTGRPMVKDWVPVFGNSSEIEALFAYDYVSHGFVEFLPGEAFPSNMPIYSGDAFVVHSSIEKTVAFDSVLCEPRNLLPGLNVVGFGCAPAEYSAYDLLNALGPGSVVSVQRFVPETGLFQTTVMQASGQPAGPDFPILLGEGYFLQMRSAVSGFSP